MLGKSAKARPQQFLRFGSTNAGHTNQDWIGMNTLSGLTVAHLGF